MKTVTIGRSSECDISIEHDLISRKHAIIKLYPWGKIEIVDMGRNGTSVNGVKLHPNSPRKIKRSDVVTFAGVKTLDWNAVPYEGRLLRWGIVLALLLVIVIAIFSFVISKQSSEDTTVRQIDDYVQEQVRSSETATGQETEEDDSWFHWPSFVKGDKKEGGSTSKKKDENSNSGAHDNPDNNKAGAGQTEDTPSQNETPSQKESSPKKNNDFFM